MSKLQAHEDLNAAINQFMQDRQKANGGMPYRAREHIPVEFFERKYVVKFYTSLKTIMTPKGGKE